MASLKLGLVALEGRGILQFHDRAVVASLKPLLLELASQCPVEIPRPRGRGLIEASGSSIIAFAPSEIPRPRGRGLIEARHPCTR